jgi:microsomal dipeptidase-like Zn-dependent dipeptidase
VRPDEENTAPSASVTLAAMKKLLMQPGVSEHDIRFIMGENFARVLAQVLPE